MTAPKVDHKYATQDWELVDYRYYRLPGTARDFRGPPLPDDVFAEGRYVSYLGAAQTFGRFVRRPFPELVAEATGIPALNLGHGGGKPAFYLRSPNVIAHVNRGRAAVVQVMSARGVGNEMMEPVNEGNVFLRLSWRPELEAQFADSAWALAVTDLGMGQATSLAVQSQQRWMEEMRQLMAILTVPVLLLWFSRRGLEWKPAKGTGRSFVGEFPQLVNRWMIEALRKEVAAYLEVISSEGPPLTTSRFDGRRVDVLMDHVRYYPTASEHEHAARAIGAELSRIATG